METEDVSWGPGPRGELRGTDVTESRAREAFLGNGGYLEDGLPVDGSGVNDNG